jgi:hypothetical protein
MPSLDEILRDTMMFAASSDLKGSPLAPGAAVSAPEPSPTVSNDEDVIKKNPVWSWKHDPGSPGTLTDVRSKVRGMGMNYSHSMPVFSSISLDEVGITKNGSQALLPITKDFVIRKYKLDSGHIPAASSGLWQLEAEIDQSIMVVFGYQFATNVPANPKPITEADIAKLGRDLMPAQGKEILPIEVGVDEQLTMWVGPLRIIVSWSITFCKERPDFTPGPPLIGMNRVYPHVMVMSSQKLERLNAVVSVVRPAKSLHAGALPPNPDTGEVDEMLADLRPILITDTNLSPISNLAPLDKLPWWSNIFDYYELDPIGNGITNVTMVDPARKKLRNGKDLVQKLVPIPGQFPPQSGNGYRDFPVMKTPRQGEFDNLHIAPRMKAPSRISVLGKPGLGLDSIVMAPFCEHDCFHMHLRWLRLVDSDPAKDKQAKGFDDSKNPYSVAGAPLVPHDQTVRVTLLPPAGFSYEAFIESLLNPSQVVIDSGEWQVFFHHGMAYANEIWDQTLMSLARAGVEALSMGTDEINFSPTTAANSYALFYWRVRFGGILKTMAERIKILNLNGCRKL